MNEREKMIGARLRGFREVLQISRSKFAVSIGYGSERIASYEAGRAPVRFEVFNAIAKTYSLSPQWLATGIGSAFYPRNVISAQISDKIPPRALFSSVYDEYLVSEIQHLKDSEEQALDLLHQKMNAFFNRVLDGRISVKDSKQAAEDLLASITEMTARLRTELISRTAFKDRVSQISTLTSITPESNSDGVKSEIKKLIERVKQKAAKPGAKAELARTLGVAPARISEWLSGEKEPGGEYTLRLLRWVEQSAS